MNKKHKHLEVVEFVEILLLVLSIICFIVGVKLASDAEKGRELSSTHFTVEVLSKENVEQGYYKYTYEYMYKVYNDSDYSIDYLNGDIRVYNARGELLSTGTVRLDCLTPLKSGKSFTWTVTTNIDSGDAAREIWDMSFSEMEIEFRISSIYFTDEGYRDYYSTAEFITIKSSSSSGQGGLNPGDSPSHTHSYTEKNTDSKYLASAADCESAAKYYYSCSCGEKGSGTFTSGSANGHSYTEQSTDSKYLASAADCMNAAKYY